MLFIQGCGEIKEASSANTNGNVTAFVYAKIERLFRISLKLRRPLTDKQEKEARSVIFVSLFTCTRRS